MKIEPKSKFRVLDEAELACVGGGFGDDSHDDFGNGDIPGFGDGIPDFFSSAGLTATDNVIVVVGNVSGGSGGSGGSGVIDSFSDVFFGDGSQCDVGQGLQAIGALVVVSSVATGGIGVLLGAAPAGFLVASVGSLAGSGIAAVGFLVEFTADGC